jgi:hypothetical protein
VTVSFYMPVCPAACIEQVGCHRTGLRDIDTGVFMKILRLPYLPRLPMFPC